MPIHAVMAAYKRAWENRDSKAFDEVFAPGGEYWHSPFEAHNTSFERAAHWMKVSELTDIAFDYMVLAESSEHGIAHWTASFEVGSEAQLRMWLASPPSSTTQVEAFKRLEVDGTLLAQFDGNGQATLVRTWWKATGQT